jgi:hypothetical protein
MEAGLRKRSVRGTLWERAVEAGCGSGPRPRKGGYAARQDPRALGKRFLFL